MCVELNLLKEQYLSRINETARLEKKINKVDTNNLKNKQEKLFVFDYNGKEETRSEGAFVKYGRKFPSLEIKLDEIFDYVRKTHKSYTTLISGKDEQLFICLPIKQDNNLEKIIIQLI